MPIYEYTCSACGEKFEKLVKSMSAAGKIPCPSCGSKKTGKVMSVCAVKGETSSVSSSSKPHSAGCACCSHKRH